jgi:signal transduction histidine kinase/ActR/RegA family two-component response regulator
MLQTITEAARDVIESHQAITLFVDPRSGQRPAKTEAFSSFSDKYSEWRGRRLQLDVIGTTLVAQSRTATRLTERELRDHPDWDIVSHAEVPPIGGGMLAAPLTGRDGANLGVIYLADRYEDEFTNDDEAILVQLAQMASIAIENTLYAEEREANRLKDEFLATLSHELRTPLNAILGWTQLLQMDGIGADANSNGNGNGERAAADAVPADAARMEEVAHGLAVLERNARSQTKLIEDLLDVSRITTGKLRLIVRPVDLCQVVRAAMDAVRPAVDAKQITLQARLDAPAKLPGDPDRLQQVFWNLLSNAAKFTPPGGRIEVSLQPAGATSVRLNVTDSGHGIDPKFLPYVFDRFRQADSSSTRSHGGLGIGLTIVRHIVELHGGTVAADSGGDGKGSTVPVTLPRTGAKVPAVAAPGAGTAASAAAQVLPARAGDVSANAHAHAPASPAHDHAAVPVDLHGTRVLLVDDEPDAREVIAHILKRCGAAITTAGSTREALEMLHGDGIPDVLVSDIAMPDEDGYCLIRELRARPPEHGGALPAIALTAYAREEDRQRALTAGFQNHLAKPVEPADLAQAIADLAPERAATPAGRA